jgi:iron complex outermembrane receptor protein
VLTAYGQGFYPQAAILQFANLKAEYSRSYEAGVKTQFADRHGVFNLTYFHQSFSNFQYANASQITLTSAGGGSVQLKGFGANVPVTINGVEGELGYRFSSHLNVDVTASYVHSEITGGTIPCNNGTVLTDSIGNSIHTCTASGPATFSPPFTATAQGEYNHEINDRMTGYLRGQLSVYGATDYNPDVPFNKQDSYALLNAYLGVRAPKGNWDVSVFVKNLTNSQTVLASAVGNTLDIGTGIPFAQPYAAISYTPPRQIGVNLRIAFGSR